MAKRKWVRKPRVQYDATGEVATHGVHNPVRIVIHDTESHDAAGIRDLKGVCDYWVNSGDGLGAHIVIDKDGNTAECAYPHEITWAVSHRNTGSLHIELIGFASFTPQMWWVRLSQLNKAAKWMAYWNKEYGIALKFNPDFGVSGHVDQPAQSHTDPGKYFPMRYLLRKANQFRDEGWS